MSPNESFITLMKAFDDYAQACNGRPDFEYYLLLIIQMLHIQVHGYDAGNKLQVRLASTTDEADPLHNDQEFLNRLLQKARAEKVFIESDHGSVVYGGLTAGPDDDTQYTYIFGPVMIGSPNQETAEFHAVRHHCPEEVYLTKGDIPSFASALLLMHAINTGEALSLNSFIARSFLNSIILKSLDKKLGDVTVLNIEGQPHHPLSMETRVLENIRLGDPDNLMKSLDYPYPGRRGTLAHDTLRSEKNIGIIDVTLSCRSAISGGLEVESAYVVADAFILQVEDAKTPQEVFAVKTAAQLRFAQLVKEAKGKTQDYLKLNKPPVPVHHETAVQPRSATPAAATADDSKLRQDKIVETVKNHVKRFINTKLTIDGISTELNLSKSYLQHVFKKHEGISLMRYCRQEKIKTAKKMLKDTDYSIAEITALLNFCSQSHFTQMFKKETGETPDVYRLKFKVTI